MFNGFTSAIKISVFGTSDMKAFGEASKRLDQFAGNFENAAKKVRAAGMKTMLVGLGLAASMAAPALETGRFNTQIAQTGGLVQATDAQLAGIADTARTLGATSMFTANAVAEGQESLVRLGLTAEDVTNRSGIMAASISFATGQQKEMAEAGTFLVGSMNAMMLPFEQATTVADKFTTVIAKSGNNFETLQESMGTSAGTAASYGQSMDTLLAVLGVLADRQEKGARAGTRLSATMTKLYTQGDKIKKALGVDVYDQATGKTRDLIDVFGDLQDRLKGMGEEQKNNALTDIFGLEGIKVFNLLLTSSKEQLLGLKGEIAGGAGAAQRFNDIILQTPKGQWELMTSAISGVTMEIGGHLIPVVMRMMGALRGAADAVLGWMKAHPVLAKVVVVFGAVAAVALVAGGALLMAAGGMFALSSVAVRLPAEIVRVAFAMKLVGSESAGALAAVRGLAGHFLKMALPVAAVVGAVLLLAKAWKTNFMGFRDTVDEVWFAIKPVFLALGGLLRTVGGWAREMFGGMLGAAWAWLSGWAAALSGGIQPILRLAGLVAWGMGFLVGVIQRAWNWIKENPIVSGLLFTSLAAFSWPLIVSAAKAVWFFATQSLLANARAAFAFGLSRVAMVKNAIVSAWAGRQFFMVRASIVAVAAAQRIATVATWLFNTAMAANPVGIVVGLVAGFVGLMVLLYQKVGPVRAVLDTIWNGFKIGLNHVIGMINAFIGGINRIPGVEIPLIPTLRTGPSLLGGGGEDLELAGTSAGLSPADAIQSAAGGGAVDRSVKVERIEVVSGPNTPAKSVKDQVIEALREVAGQDDGLEGMVYAGA